MNITNTKLKIPRMYLQDKQKSLGKILKAESMESGLTIFPKSNDLKTGREDKFWTILIFFFFSDSGFLQLDNSRLTRPNHQGQTIRTEW